MMHADDTKAYRPIVTSRDAEQLQRDLDALTVWSNRWQLPFNTDKCKVMHLGTENTEHQYTMAGTELETTSEEKDLGILVGRSLTFHAQAASAVAKAFRTLGMICRAFLTQDEATLPLLFKAMVRPILEYGNCVWGPVLCGDQDKVERVQRRATKMAPSVRHLPYQVRLESLKLPSMSYRRECGTMIMVYHILT